MHSFEYGYILETPISHRFAMSLRALGEFRGRQTLYSQQSPEILETLRRAAMIQSAESSNRIEGIVVPPNRIEPLIDQWAKPKNRPEQEVAGYRDVLDSIHTNAANMPLSVDLVKNWHQLMYRYTDIRGGTWKTKDNAIFEIQPDGNSVVRFTPTSALATPKSMANLIRLFKQEIDQNNSDPLLLVAGFILDFECIHPFMDGNGRIGRLLTLLLLYQTGYNVGRFISLERIVEDSKKTYYEALWKSSQGWHKGAHDLRPWWEYFIGMLTAAYNDFEIRVGKISSARGAKQEMVENAILRLLSPFRLSDIQRACPGISYPTLKRALADLKRKKKVRCLSKGRDAQWERIESKNS